MRRTTMRREPQVSLTPSELREVRQTMQPTTPLPGETCCELSDMDRRSWPRFDRRVRVLMMPEDCALDEPYGGWIVNGSRGGVRLHLLTRDIEEGTVLHLRRPQSERHVPWVAV